LKTGWQVHAYCLMRNHYHLVLETPNANLVAGMAWLQSTYTIRLNNRRKLVGHLLSGRYRGSFAVQPLRPKPSGSWPKSWRGWAGGRRTWPSTARVTHAS
jgi:REP element-mobilizing transposase RayT